MNAIAREKNIARPPRWGWAACKAPSVRPRSPWQHRCNDGESRENGGVADFVHRFHCDDRPVPALIFAAGGNAARCFNHTMASSTRMRSKNQGKERNAVERVAIEIRKPARVKASVVGMAMATMHDSRQPSVNKSAEIRRSPPCPSAAAIRSISPPPFAVIPSRGDFHLIWNDPTLECRDLFNT